MLSIVSHTEFYLVRRVAADNCSGYKLTPPNDPGVDSRPAYGGTCYSPFTVDATQTAVAYDTDGSTRLQPWAASTSGANAYAHPIDGFADSVPPLGCSAVISTSRSSNISSSETISSAEVAPSLSSTATLGNTTTAATSSNKTPSGTIAGAAVGGVIGLLIIVGLVFFLLRRRRRQSSYSAPNVHQIGDNPHPRAEKDGNVITAEMDSGVPAAELAEGADKYAGIHGTHGMSAGVAHEMPAGPELHNIRGRTGV
jgi:hypothetical protein